MKDLMNLLQLAVQKQASDIHLKAGIVPVIRKHGKLRLLDEKAPVLTGPMMEQLAQSIMNAEQKEEFAHKKEVDIGYGVKGLGRFRINIFKQRGTTRMVIRSIPFEVPSIESLKLPEVVRKIAEFERGLILVTGASGSGKSSTMAGIINHINSKKSRHIITIEDPIEYLIRDKKSIITQRELGLDAQDFPSALRGALRQDPDVILIGEMRDHQTIETALTAAETGHLVISTLHTLDAQESINRILSVFNEHKQTQVRLQLASVLRAIISQRLAQHKSGDGFAPAVEVMINNSRIRDMIEKPNRTKEIIRAIEESQDSYGMQSFDQSLMEMVNNNLIDYTEALRLSDNAEDFAIHFEGVSSNRSPRTVTQVKHNSPLKEDWFGVPEIEVELSKTFKKKKKK